MNIVNLTPHTLTIFSADGKTVLAAAVASENPARVTVTREQTGEIPIEWDPTNLLVSTPTLAWCGEVVGLPVFASRAGAVTGLPAPVKGTVYIVSALVRLAVPDRKDVFSPGELVRGADGQPIGCKGLDSNW